MSGMGLVVICFFCGLSAAFIGRYKGSSFWLWFAVGFFLPILGTYIVWMPAAIYLGMIGNWGGAAAILVYGVVSWCIVDNIIYVRIAGDRMHLHEVPALLAFLGGLAVFGASGMILGPAILAVTVAILEVWHYRAEGEAIPAPEEKPAAAAARPDPVSAAIAPAH